MKKIEMLNLLYEQDILHEEDTWTVCGENDVDKLFSLKNNILIVFKITDQDHLERWKKALQGKYEEDALIQILESNGKILKISIKEFNNCRALKEAALILKFSEMKLKKRGKDDFSPLIDVMKILKSPNGCPWDRKQDHKTLRTYFIQEVYEVVDAIDKNDMTNLCEELGDVLFQVVFHSVLAEEEGYFSVQTVINNAAEKMKRRHPFLFEKEGEFFETEGDINWEKRKRKEKNRRYLLSGVPKCLPSLLLACIIQKKVSSVGIHASSENSLNDTVYMRETKNGTEDESAGAFLFEQVRVLQEKGIDPELSLHRFCVEFMERFSSFEESLQGKQQSMDKMSADALTQAWMEFNGKDM